MHNFERDNPLRKTVLDYSDMLHLKRYTIAQQYTRGKILDLACGVGYGAPFLNADGRNSYTGVDSDLSAIQAARTNYTSFGEFIVADASGKLPFDDNTFDSVCSLETIEHLEHALHTHFYGELLRVLKPNGLLVLSTPNRDWRTKRALQQTGWVNPYHKYEYNTGEFDQFVRKPKGSMVRVLRRFHLGYAVNLSGTIYPHWFSRTMRLHRLPIFARQALDRVDLALGALTPRYTNCLCYVIQKVNG